MDLTNRFFGSVKRVWGKNATVGTSYEVLNDLSSNVDQAVALATAAAVAVSSSSAQDAAAGTGATKIRIYGLDANFNPQTEDIVPTGQTAVAGTKTWKRVFGASVITHSTGKANAGDIYVVVTGTGGTYTGGVPGTLTSALCKMPAGENMAMAGTYTVPTGKTVRLLGVTYGNYTQAATLGIFSRPNGTDFTKQLDIPIGLGNQASGAADVEKYEQEYGEKTDIILMAKGAAASAVTTALMVLKEV